MWNFLKRTPPKSEDFHTEMCIAYDPDVPTTVGYLDDNKIFHYTK